LASAQAARGRSSARRRRRASDRAALDVVARVADDHRQAQAEQTQREAGVLQRRLHLAQAAALAEGEVADAAQLALREAGGVDVGDQVGAVAMVIVMRDHHPRLVQPGRPRQLAAAFVAGLGKGAGEQRGGNGADAPRLGDVDLEATLQLAHRIVAHVAAVGAALGVAARREVEDHALAQRSARRPELGDAEVGRERVEDGEAAADDCAAIVPSGPAARASRRCRPRGIAPSASAGRPG
jgi:hypothetical protein